MWLGLNVGTDVALANTMAREIIHAGLVHSEFIKRGTTNYQAYKRRSNRTRSSFGERVTGIPADVIRDAAHAYATADRAMICWTLGITEHHNAVDNVLALINLSLLTGHVGRYGLRLQSAPRTEQRPGRRRHGRAAEQAPGLPGRHRPRRIARSSSARGDATSSRRHGWNLTEMIHAMETKELTALYVIGENPAQSDADAHARDASARESRPSRRAGDLPHENRAARRRRASRRRATWAEGEGTVTNSERRVQRCRKAVEPPGDARDEIWIMSQLAKRLGYDWGSPTAEDVWNEVRALVAAARRA